MEWPHFCFKEPHLAGVIPIPTFVFRVQITMSSISSGFFTLKSCRIAILTPPHLAVTSPDLNIFTCCLSSHNPHPYSSIAYPHHGVCSSCIHLVKIAFPQSAQDCASNARKVSQRFVGPQAVRVIAHQPCWNSV